MVHATNTALRGYRRLEGRLEGRLECITESVIDEKLGNFISDQDGEWVEGRKEADPQ